jgi:beta-lactamase regulating signal transducer with metallopeptidase domain
MNWSFAASAESLTGWLADFYLLATLLLVLGCVALRWTRQPVRRLSVAWTLIVELVVLAVVCALPGWPRISLIGAAPRPADLPVLERTGGNRGEHLALLRNATRPLERPGRTSTTGVTAENRDADLAVSLETYSSDSPRWIPALPSRAAVVSGCFLIGMSWVVVWLLWGAVATRRLCRGASPAPSVLVSELSEIVRGAPQPRLLLNPHIGTAAALGVLRPTILLPSALAQEGPPQSLRVALQHEWAHIRNHDLWLLALVRCLLAVLFAHPLYWWLRRQIRDDQETLADAVAARENRHDYAEQLLRWARWTAGLSGANVSAALGIWEGSSQLARRIGLLLDETVRIETAVSRRWQTGTLGLLAMVGLALSVLTLRAGPSTGGEPARQETIQAKVEAAARSTKQGTDHLLFDFEDAAALANWSNVDLQAALEQQERLAEKTASGPKVKPAKKKSATGQAGAAAAKEPPVELALSREHATSGGHSLKLTYAGGSFPTIGTDTISIDDWSHYKTFRADVTASRTCIVIFRVLREKSRRGSDWDNAATRYEKVARLEPGRNEVVELTWAGNFTKLGKIVRFEITMYAPQPGESIFVDHIRLSPDLPKATSSLSYMNAQFLGEQRANLTYFTKLDQKIRVLGTDWQFANLNELGDQVRDQWVMPQKKTVDQIEGDWAAAYRELKKTHPKAVMAVLRDGQQGYDPANPEQVFHGWRNTQLQGRDPPAAYARNLGKTPGRNITSQLSVRRSCPLLKVDLSSIPCGSQILMARLLLVKHTGPDPRKQDPKKDAASPFKPTLFAAEPCNRDWDEDVCNAVEYAEGKFWQESCGQCWSGSDPDFLPLVVAYGQEGWDDVTIDFTAAVRHWTEGNHPNYGFALSCPTDYQGFSLVWLRHTPVIKKRPAMMVVYDPA